MKKDPTKEEFENDLRDMIRAIGSVERFLPPQEGYIRTVRKWRGMSGASVARRMGIKPQSLAGIEKSEQDGDVRLKTLRLAANAIDCTVVYILIPNAEILSVPAVSAAPAMKDNLQSDVVPLPPSSVVAEPRRARAWLEPDD
jgi:predicted DNA-binding mobile mystery protein A